MAKGIIIVLAVVVLAVAGFFAWNGTPAEAPTAPENTSAGSPEVSSGAHTIRVTESGFEPAALTVKSGDRVTWVNDTVRSVWPASAMHPTHAVYPTTGGCIGSTFDACRGLAPGDSWAFVFGEVGTWKYHDHLRATVFGSVTVE